MVRWKANDIWTCLSMPCCPGSVKTAEWSNFFDCPKCHRMVLHCWLMTISYPVQFMNGNSTIFAEVDLNPFVAKAKTSTFDLCRCLYRGNGGRLLSRTLAGPGWINTESWMCMTGQMAQGWEILARTWVRPRQVAHSCKRPGYFTGRME